MWIVEIENIKIAWENLCFSIYKNKYTKEKHHGKSYPSNESVQNKIFHLVTGPARKHWSNENVVSSVAKWNAKPTKMCAQF